MLFSIFHQPSMSQEKKKKSSKVLNVPKSLQLQIEKLILPDPWFTSGVNRVSLLQRPPRLGESEVSGSQTNWVSSQPEILEILGIWPEVTSSGCQSQDFHTPHPNSTRLNLEANLHLGFPLPFRVTPTGILPRKLSIEPDNSWGSQYFLPLPHEAMLCRVTSF